MRKPDAVKYSSGSYATLMYILETLPECSEETIHKVYVALEAAKKREEAGRETLKSSSNA